MGLRGPGVGRSQTLTPRVDHQLTFLGGQKAAKPLTALTGHWPSQKSAAKLHLLRQSFAARILERLQERPECRKSQELRDNAIAIAK